eukprot:6741961-Pyramimonas_sp.AAC.1
MIAWFAELLRRNRSSCTVSQRTAVQPRQLMIDARHHEKARPIGRRKRGYILTMDLSDAGSAGLFLRRRVRARSARNHAGAD